MALTSTSYLARRINHIDHAVDLVLDTIHRLLSRICVTASAVAGRGLATG